MSHLHVGPVTPITAGPRVGHLQQSSLHLHYLQCQIARTAWFRVAAVLERMHDAIAPRFVTTVSAVAMLMVVVNVWS